MAALLYSAIASLDGYTVDADGSFAWAEPAADVHAHVNEQEAAVGTYLYGRRMYETMKAWQELGIGPEEPAVTRRYGEVWRGADKIVYSATLDAVSTPKTRLERTFDPNTVRAMKDMAGPDVSVGGPTLAAAALGAGLVDELQIYVIPVVVGGGTPWLPDGVRLRLDLRDERRFADGTVHLRYAARPWAEQRHPSAGTVAGLRRPSALRHPDGLSNVPRLPITNSVTGIDSGTITCQVVPRSGGTDFDSVGLGGRFYRARCTAPAPFAAACPTSADAPAPEQLRRRHRR